uniref:C3H1-type domain-containing protein n=1 Tax=Nymphaea colorata TaxID=210225 RepID=A0A5K1HN08_9MAGN|nr:unnamed protein product [Nymphaea colorata]
MRKISTLSTVVPPLFEATKPISHSLSTEESPRERPPQPSHKEKSQLCKKFVENGYCPYEKRCKFAHGLQELKKNHQANCKYKTKVCGGFLQEGFCPYGNRCNFIHPPSAPTPARARNLDPAMLSIRTEAATESRLLRLLERD